MVVQRGPNRDDVTPIEFYQPTPEKYIVRPTLLIQQDCYIIQVYFSIPLKETSNLLNPATYTLVDPLGAQVSISAVSRDHHKKLDFTIPALTIDGYYTFTIVKEILGFNEVPILLHSNYAYITKYISIPTGPELIAVNAMSAIAIDVSYDSTMSSIGLDTVGNYTLSSYPSASFWTGTAATVDEDEVLLTSNRDLTFDPDLIDTTNYSISPALAIDFIQIMSSKSIKLYISDYMHNGTVYEITPSNDVTDIDAQPIDPVAAKPTFVGLAALPQVVSASVIDPITIDILYDKNMEQTAAETTTNYDVRAGMVTLSVLGASLQGDLKTVRLTLDPAFAILYTVTISNVTDTGLNVIDPLHDSATFTGVATEPEVASATSIDYQTLRVVFDSEMSHTGLDTPANYTFTCPGALTLTTNTATIIDNYTVELTVNEEMRTGTANYTVIANGALENSYGVPLNPAHKTATFDGIGIAPQVVSATAVDVRTIDVLFDEEVEEISAETTGNYAVTGASSPNVSAAVKQPDTVTVQLTLDVDMIVGDYTVTVTSVTDLAGNVVDPAHDTGIFEITIIPPQVVSATYIIPTQIYIDFDKDMSDVGLTTTTNYVIT